MNDEVFLSFYTFGFGNANHFRIKLMLILKNDQLDGSKSTTGLFIVLSTEKKERHAQAVCMVTYNRHLSCNLQIIPILNTSQDLIFCWTEEHRPYGPYGQVRHVLDP